MSRQHHFLDKSNWKDIDRNFEYEAVMFYPSDTKRPLTFFVPEQDDRNKGTLVHNQDDFSPQLIDGKYRAVERQAVISMKPRKVIVLTDNQINQSVDFDYILVAPINTIKPDEKQKAWYQKLKSDNHPIFVYLPNGDFERYVDLTQTTSIHKGLLLRKTSEISGERFSVLEEVLAECLSLGIVEEVEQDLADASNE